MGWRRARGLERNGQRDAGPHLSRVAGDYVERPPADALRTGVRCVWRNRLRPTGRPLLVVPDGCTDLLWTGEALLVAGPDTGPVIESVAPGATVVGVRFRPGAARRWLDVPAAAIANRRLPLAELWGNSADRLAAQLSGARTWHDAAAVFEQFLTTRIRHDAGPDLVEEALRRAIVERLAGGEVRVRDLAAGLGTSARTVRRRCHEVFGYGPKTVSRILRFQRFLAHAQRPDRAPLAVLAHRCGYADQAHLTRDVRRLSGLTPAMVVAQLDGADAAPAVHTGTTGD